MMNRKKKEEAMISIEKMLMGEKSGKKRGKKDVDMCLDSTSLTIC